MSQDLYQSEVAESLSGLRPVAAVEPGMFDNFASGTGRLTMRGLAGIGSGVDILGGALARIQDKVMGTDTEAQDRYFKEHEDVFGSAMDFWTPRPNEVGVAGEVVSGLLTTLPLALAAPELLFAGVYGHSAEDLVKRGVGAGKAQAVGALETSTLALGLWMPVLGQTGWQRVLVGGASYNAMQGILQRGAAGEILRGTAAENDFKAFDPKALTLDVLMGLAFGTFAHLSTAQREQSSAAWQRLMDWAKEINPSDVDAIAALRQAQHLNVDSAPGKLASAQDVEAHTQRVRTAIDQLAKGEQVSVDDLPKPAFEPDAKRARDALKTFETLQKTSVKVSQEEGIAPGPELRAQQRFAEWMGSLSKKERSALETSPGLEAMYERAFHAEKSFADVMKELSEETGAQVQMGPIKSPARASEKIGTEYRGDASRIKDLVRGSLVVESPEQATQLIQAIAKRTAIIGEVRNALDPSAPPVDSSGYRDAKMNILVNGHVVEVQVHVPEVIKAKEELHGLYEQREKITRKAAVEGRDLTPEEAIRRGELTTQMKATYDTAWAAFLARKTDSATSVPLRSTESTGKNLGADESQARAAAPEGSSETGTPSTSKNLVPLGKADSTAAILPPETEAPVAKVGAAEPPPPRGRDGAGKAAGATANPHLAEAERLIAEAPELTLRLGTNADGSPMLMHARDYLAQVKEGAKALRERAKLIGVAAECLMGIL